MNDADHRLIDAYLDGNITHEQGERLETLLRGNPEARATLRRNATIDEFLTDTAAASVVRNRLHGANAESIANPGASRKSKWMIAMPWAIAATLAAVLLSKTLFVQDIRDTGPNPEAFVGLLVDENDAQFESGFAPDNFKFDSGEYRLNQGAIQLRLNNGTDLVMKAPVDFRLIDPFHLSVQRGGLRAIVPPTGEGFTVLAPGVDYVDLGTEFGINVNPESGNSQLHVFDGQVNARNRDSNRLLSEVMGGESVEFSQGKLSPTESAERDEFLKSGTIGLLRWKKQCEELRSHPDLIAFYPFEKSDTLVNSAKNSVVSDGEINGARWVSGRWPGKSALLFDRNWDYVQFEIPGEYQELTFSTWIKLDGTANYLNTIFNSNGKEPGDVHWYIESDGTMILLRCTSKHENRMEKHPLIPIGHWVHLAGTISDSGRKRNVYLNGELAGFSDGKQGALTPGQCRLGGWLSNTGRRKRQFRGRMDEFAIWDRALSPDEIKQLTESGKPNVLWSMPQ